jgi:hypothetical protein
MGALAIMVLAFAGYIIMYQLYGNYIGRKIFALSGEVKTPSRELEEKVLAGPYHPAFGELVVSRALFKQARRLLSQAARKEKKHLSFAAADESAFRGPGNVSTRRLAALDLLDGVELVFDKGQPRNSVLVY